MNRTIIAALLVLVHGASLATAQSVFSRARYKEDDPSRQDDLDATFAHWKWVQEVKLPAKIDGPYLSLSIPPGVFDKSEPDLHDLRLADAKGDRIQYVLRVVRPEPQHVPVPILRTFNQGPSGAGPYYYQISVELGDSPGHDEIEINTPGMNFRRQVEVFGDSSSTFKNEQRILEGKKYLVKYEDKADNKVVDVRRFRYAAKQFHFLRVRVYPDPLAEDAKAEEQLLSQMSVIVRRSHTQPGKYVTEQATLGQREIVPGPGSAWLIDLPGKMPCEKLTFELDGPVGVPAARHFSVQAADPGQPRTDLDSQELIDFGWRNNKRFARVAPMAVEEKKEFDKSDENKGQPEGMRWVKDGERTFLEVSFPEVSARRLRLIVVDSANPPFKFKSEVKATRCVRELVFAKPDEGKTLPLKLFMGNSAVGSPNFDLAKTLPAQIAPAPAEVELVGEVQKNPTYQPPPQTLNERFPWLVYTVLGAACAVLLVILGGLARQAVGRHDKASAAPAPV